MLTLNIAGTAYAQTTPTTCMIVETGDASPDGNGTFFTLLSWALNDKGQVAFEAPAQRRALLKKKRAKKRGRCHETGNVRFYDSTSSNGSARGW